MTIRGTALAALAFGLFAFMRLDVAVSEAQPPDPRVADLVHAGKIRVALFLPQYTKHPVTGELQGAASGGVHIEIARAFAAHLGAQVVLAGYPAPPRVVECLKADTCDIAFMGINPARAKEVGFAPSHMEVDFTYLVPAGCLSDSNATPRVPSSRTVASMSSTSQPICVLRIALPPGRRS